MTSTAERLAAVAVAVSVLVAACSSSDPQNVSPSVTPEITSAPSTVPEAEAPTTSQAGEVLSLEETSFGLAQAVLVDESVTEVDKALAEFALYFGPVPGSPDFGPDGSEPGTATSAIDAIDVVFDDLNAEQQAAVLDRLRPLFENAFIEPEGFRRAELTPLQRDFTDLAAGVAARVSSELGGVALDYDILFIDDDPAAGELVTNFGWATMSLSMVVGWLERLAGSYAAPTTDCAIAIGPRGLALSGSERTSAVAHEMFHCWSIMNSPDTAAHERTPSWYQEGVASWVGEEIANGSSYSTNWWAYYMDSGEFALVAGVKYPAIGFWSWIDSHSGDLWALIPALHAAAITGDPLSVFNIATSSMDADARASWASARVRTPGWGEAWDMDGPGIGSRAHSPPPLLMPVGPERTFDTSALGITNVFIDPLEDVTVADDRVLGVSMRASGTWRVRWESGEEMSSVTGPGVRAWCATSPCVCPDGSTPEGFSDAIPGSGELAVALSGNGTSIGSLSVQLTELCDDEPDDPGDASPAGLIGTWRATPDAMTRFGEVVFAGREGAEYIGTNGDATMTFVEGATGTLLYDNVRIVASVGGVVVDIGVSGGGSFTYELQDSTMIVVGTDMALTFDVLGEPLVLTGDDVPLGGESRFTWLLEGDSLILQQQSLDAKVPNDWRRVD